MDSSIHGIMIAYLTNSSLIRILENEHRHVTGVYDPEPNASVRETAPQFFTILAELLSAAHSVRTPSRHAKRRGLSDHPAIPSSPTRTPVTR